MSTATDLTVRDIRTACGAVEVAQAGAGPAVLLIHGTPGSWRQLVPLGLDLADRHTVLLPSRPGYGRTPIRSGRTPSEQAALYAALLDSLGITSPIGVVGVSGGGPSALAFAQEHSERTDSLALVCALAAHLMPIPVTLRVLTRVPAVVKPFTAVSRRRQRALLDDSKRIDDRIARDLTPDELERLGAEPTMRDDLVAFLRSHADAPSGLLGLANDARQMHAVRGRPQPADAVTRPTLVLHGDADTVVPVTHAHHHAAVIPHAELVVLNQAGHIFNVTRRAETNAVLRDHLVRRQ